MYGFENIGGLKKIPLNANTDLWAMTCFFCLFKKTLKKITHRKMPNIINYYCSASTKNVKTQTKKWKQRYFCPTSKFKVILWEGYWILSMIKGAYGKFPTNYFDGAAFLHNVKCREKKKNWWVLIHQDNTLRSHFSCT